MGSGLVLLSLLMAVGVWASFLGQRPDVPSSVPRVTYALVGLTAAVDLCDLSAFSEHTWGDLVGGIFIAFAWLASVAPITWALWCTWRWGPRRIVPPVLLACGILAIFAAYHVGANVRASADREERERTIAIRWSDVEYFGEGQAIRVYEIPVRNSGEAWDVRASVGSDDRWHDCGVIGRTAGHVESVRRFSVISWRPDGVHFGTEWHEEYFLPRQFVQANCLATSAADAGSMGENADACAASYSWGPDSLPDGQPWTLRIACSLPNARVSATCTQNPGQHVVPLELGSLDARGNLTVVSSRGNWIFRPTTVAWGSYTSQTCVLYVGRVSVGSFPFIRPRCGPDGGS
jgi:hypothetical protein